MALSLSSVVGQYGRIQNLIADCEKELPRTEYCKIIAIPEQLTNEK